VVWEGRAGNRSPYPDVYYLHLDPVRRGLVSRPEDWRWSSYNNCALDKATVAACPIQIDRLHLAEGYRAREEPTVKNALTVATNRYRLRCPPVSTRIMNGTREMLNDASPQRLKQRYWISRQNEVAEFVVKVRPTQVMGCLTMWNKDQVHAWHTEHPLQG
jgi:hypothetical protein